MRTGWRWVADVASHRGRLVGRVATHLLWNWVRHHPWDAGLMLRVLDTARDPQVSGTAARLLEQAWARGAMRPALHRAIATYPRPFPPHPRTHRDRRMAYAHFAGAAEECRLLDPDRRILDRCLGRSRSYQWHPDPERRWTVDAERERQLAARRQSPPLGGGAGGPGSSGGAHGIPGSGYSTGFGGSF